MMKQWGTVTITDLSFKVKKIEHCIYLLLILGGLGLYFITRQLSSQFWKDLLVLSSFIICIFSFIHILFFLTKPYLHISQANLSIRRSFFTKQKKYDLSRIQEIIKIKPDSYILLFSMQGQHIKIPIHRLSKENRIRLIFLLESDMNRKNAASYSQSN